MTKFKCPPNTVCLSHMMMGLVVILFSYIVYTLYNYTNMTMNNNNNNNNNTTNNTYTKTPQTSVIAPNYPYNNIPQGDVLLNPLVPPYRDERYLTTTVQPPLRVPINVQTNISAVDTPFRQVGILTPLNSQSVGNILPLMGRPLYTRRGLWNYYTISNQHNNVKLPILVKNRQALNDNGVDEVFEGDTVFVEGYNTAFKVTKYENETIRYLPFI